MNHKPFFRFGRVALAALMFCSFTAIAQTNTAPPDTSPGVASTNTAPNPDFDAGHAALPTSKEDYWKYGIALVTPFIVYGFARLGPSVPVFVLPLLAPLIGLLLGALMNWLGKANMAWVDMVQAGGLAVWLRELTNQLVTKRMAGEAIQKTKMLIAIAAIGLTVGATGCARNKLAPGGAYAPTVVVTQPDGSTVTNATAAPDMELFATDAAFDFAYSAVLAVFEFERANRDLLWRVNPNIKHKLDAERPKVVEIVKAWAAARKAYIANPVPGNMAPMQEALAKIRAINAAVTTAIPQRK